MQIITANLHQVASEIRVATLPAGQTVGAGQPGGTASNVFLLEAASEAQASEMVGMELVFSYSSASNNWYVVPNQSSGSFAAIASYVPTVFAGLVVVVDGAGQGDGLYRWRASTSSYVLVGGQ
ncbi:MAG: hypothetical protein HC771_12205 [Synechococcales cyanobacterium CRU_2_2]|nr:hypothetical protein [Synechococcales cyanobacterium CRU_2_2]